MAVFHEQDWQSDQSMKHVQKAKPHQKHEQISKPYQKPHQKHETWHQEELPFNRDKPWRETPLTDTEIEKLFWRQLVQLGWRWQTYGLDRKNIVLPCPYCNLLVDSHTIITDGNAKRMQDKNYCEQVLKRHKGLECKAILEEDFNANEDL
jgi:hypothetical protein